MDETRLHDIEKEIVRQMGVETISEAMLKGYWEKVDPDIIKQFEELTNSRIAETMRGMDKGISPEILAKIKADDPAKAFLLS